MSFIGRRRQASVVIVILLYIAIDENLNESGEECR